MPKARKTLVGCAHNIRQACEQMGKAWVHGLRRCAEVFPDSWPRIKSTPVKFNFEQPFNGRLLPDAVNPRFHR